MIDLPDGTYLSYPIHGPASATRVTVVKGGRVQMGEWSFAQRDFFSVNTLVPIDTLGTTTCE